MRFPPVLTNSSDLRQHDPSTRRRLATALLVAIAALGIAAGAHAQASDGLKAGAYDAQRNADEAAAAAEAARKQAAEAAERLKAAEEAAAQAKATAATQAAAVDRAEATTPAATSSADAAVAEARAEAAAANDKAEAALLAVAALKARFAYDRKGAYLGGGVFWAPQAFNLTRDFDVSDSRGLSGWLGYRISSHFAVEARVDYLDDFKLQFVNPVDGSVQNGELRGWLTTVSAKIYLMTGRFQPYFDLGVGAFIPQSDIPSLDMNTNAAFRGSAGFDIYLSPSVVVNLNAAFVSPTGDLDFVKFGQLGGGLTFRF